MCLWIASDRAFAVELRWFGQSMVSVTAQDGTVVVIDPFADDVGYPVPDLSASVVLVSHGHFDHSNVASIAGDPQIFREATQAQIGDLQVRSVQTYHDNLRGFDRGNNLVWVVEVEGLSIAHLGDLGHTFTPEQLEQLRETDVCFVPVGGVYTIDAASATTIVDQMGSVVVIPIHYRTPGLALDIPLAPVDGFLADKPRVERPTSPTFTVAADTLPDEPTIVVLPYE
jgi:L-ascorbate metabolism protein UlaG (beta-lactamase superfamily)